MALRQTVAVSQNGIDIDYIRNRRWASTSPQAKLPWIFYRSSCIRGKWELRISVVEFIRAGRSYKNFWTLDPKRSKIKAVRDGLSM